MALGGYGVVSVAAHLVGPQIAELISAFVAGDTARAAELHHRLMPLVDALFGTSRPHGDPHGRPTFVQLEMSELHRRFGRT